MNRRSVIKGLLLAPFAGLLAPVSKLFGESVSAAPVFRASRTHAQPQRIDTFSLKHWGKVTTQPIEFYDVAGQTVFPRYGKDGKLMGAVCMVMFPVEMPEGFAEPKMPVGF